MERFEVEGTSLVSWTIRVQARSEGEAAEEAQRIAGWIDVPSSLVTVRGAQHRVVRLSPADSEDW